eukprot:1159663-Pelagomonas_calceolata.AAC.4
MKFHFKARAITGFHKPTLDWLVSVAGAVSLLSLAKQRYKLQGSKLAGPTLTQQCNPFGSDGRMGIPGTLHRWASSLTFTHFR